MGICLTGRRYPVINSLLTQLTWLSWHCKLGMLALEIHHHFFHPSQKYKTMQITQHNLIDLINFQDT